MASYQELKARLATKPSRTGSSKSVSYADLKQRVSPLIASSNLAKRRQEEEKQNQVIEQANKAIGEQQAYQERLQKRSEGGIIDKGRAFLSSIRNNLGLNDSKTVLPVIENAPEQYKQIQQQQEDFNKNYSENWLGRGGNAIIGAGKFLGSKAKDWGKAGAALLQASQAQYLPEEQRQQAVQEGTDVLTGAGKNIKQLGTGTAKFGARIIQKASEIAPTTATKRYAENKGITVEEANKEFKTKIDNNGILNYEPKYKSEYEKTGGEIAEIGSWFIPVSRIGKIGKIEKALAELPAVAKFLGATPKIIKSGGKLFYEVAKDTADIAALDVARGKDWESIKSDLTVGGIGAGVLRGTGALTGAIFKSNPTKLIEKSIGKLSDEEAQLSEKLLSEGKTTDEILSELSNLRESNIFTQLAEELTPRTLKPGELAPTVARIESQIEKLTPSKALEVKSALEKGYSEESIIKSLQDTGEVIPKAIEAPKLTPEPVKTEIPQQEQIKSIEGQITPTEQLVKQGEAKAIKTEVEAGKTSLSPIVERVNKNLDEATRIDEKLATTNHKEQLKLAEENILKDPEKAYNDVVFGETKMSEPLKTSQLTILFENAKLKGDKEAMAEIGSALAKHGRKSGQEVEMIKAMIQDNPTNKAIVDLAKAKLEAVAAKFKKLSVKKGEDAVEKVNKIVKDTHKRILLKERVAKVNDARNLIKSLTC